MIPVEDAIAIVEKTTFPTIQSYQVKVPEAIGFVLSEDVMSPINMPPFRQSAMDGYAVRLHNDLTYELLDY